MNRRRALLYGCLADLLATTALLAALLAIMLGLYSLAGALTGVH